MNSQEKTNKKIQNIHSSIERIKLSDYELFEYDLKAWEITIEQFPQHISYINYARVHVFNTRLDSIVNKYILKRYELITEDEFENPAELNCVGFLVLKYPFSKVPELNHNSL
ncbi:hypothetical protein [Pedobacter jeongneungensis]|uniref:hypothetical protein n=1 Tax=Pedobacter jeongneungensis TaxID=947309 RepID=UPI00046AE187|nr:hypothetical protein [Pedobacter jeongneungensis]